MPGTTLFQKLTSGLRAISSWDYRIALYVAALTTIISALRVSFNLGENYGTYESLDGNHMTCCVHLLEQFLIAITLGLIIATVGLWSRKVMGYFLSLLALLGVAALYVQWRVATLAIIRDYEAEGFSPSADQGEYLPVLLNAMWWDWVVLAVTLILFLWQIKTLFTINRSVKPSM